MNKNTIALQNGFVVPNPIYQDNRIMVSTLQVELLRLGYVLTEEAFMELSESDSSFIEQWFNDVVTYLQDWLDLEKYEPIYKNFPKSVMERSLEELFFNKLLHYWSNGAFEFDEPMKREIRYEEVDWKEIKLGTEENFKNIFKKLVQSPVVLPPQDLKVVEWFINSYKSYNMPESIPFKENLCILASYGIDVPVKTSTDVLRIATYLSYGKSDLLLPPRKTKLNRWSSWVDNPERKKFKFKLNTAQRRLIMSLLDKVAYVPEMKERKGMWNKLAHHLHPSSFEETYFTAVQALRVFSSNKKLKQVKTYDAKVENNPLDVKLSLLEKRPGKFARKLNELLLHYPDRINEILISFQGAAVKISNKVLFELITYFVKRTEYNNSRKVFIKGARKPVELPTLPILEQSVVDNIINTIWDVFQEKFMQLEPLGKVYIDPNLDKIPLPLNMRTLEESLAPVIRGQRVPLALDKQFAILFACWEGSSDLDISATMVDYNNELLKVGWNGYDRVPGITFSGDNTGNYQYNSEMICIDLLNTTARYILFSVNVYRGGTFQNIKPTIGIMSRSEVFVSKNFKPETVQHVMKPTHNSKQINVFIFDIETKEWIMIDESTDEHISSASDVLEYINMVSKKPKFSVHDLMLLHAISRGTVVPEVEDADVTFLFEDFSKDYKKTIEYML